MACSACEEAKKMKEQAAAEAAKRRGAGSTAPGSYPINLCTAVKNYVAIALSRQVTQYRNIKKFNSSVGLPKAPHTEYYSYGFTYIGKYYAKFQAIPLKPDLPTMVGYVYVKGSTNAYTIDTLVQLSKTKSISNLITTDEPVKIQLRTESGWSPNCT
jgi:hypothetical protein